MKRRSTLLDFNFIGSAAKRTQKHREESEKDVAKDDSVSLDTDEDAEHESTASGSVFVAA